MSPLTPAQIAACIVSERAAASISVAFTLAMFITYGFLPRFRTLSNTLMVFASFANLGANAAALIGGAALSRVNGNLCQFQGFLLEW
jgi:hypothetical protein